MKILIDALSAREGGGITYMTQLLPELVRASPSADYHILLAPSYQGGLIDSLPSGARLVSAPLRNSNVLARAWYEQTALPLLLRRENFRAVFTASEAGAVRTPCPHVVLAQNLNIFASSDIVRTGGARRRAVVRRLARQRVAALSLRAADWVVCVSETFRGEIVRRFGLNPATTSVVHHGVSPFFSAPREPSGEGISGLPEGYLLAVSSIVAHKNYHVLLDAYSSVCERLGVDTPPLVIAGALTDPVLFKALQTKLVSSRLADRVRFVGRVEQSALPALYRGAAIFLSPTCLESFGLPLLESMAAGTPAIVSDLAIYREIGGDAPRFVPVGNEGALATAIVELLASPEQRAAMSERGRQRAAGFSWATTARAMTEIFSEVGERTRKKSRFSKVLGSIRARAELSAKE